MDLPHGPEDREYSCGEPQECAVEGNACKTATTAATPPRSASTASASLKSPSDLIPIRGGRVTKQSSANRITSPSSRVHHEVDTPDVPSTW